MLFGASLETKNDIEGPSSSTSSFLLLQRELAKAVLNGLPFRTG